MSDPVTVDTAHQIPCHCAADDSSPPATAPVNGKRINGHVGRGELVEALDFGKVSRSATAALLIAARRLARG